jgi:cellulose biosynthesis protein BcsQ
MFLDNEINLKKHDWEKIISKQFSILEKKYDYIIFNVDHVGNTLVTACLNISREVFAVFNSNTFTSNDLQKILTNIRKIQISNNNIKLTTIILNNYNQHLHLESLMSVSKLTNSTYSLITLPLQNEFWEINEQSVKFIKYNKWNNYTISLSKVVEQLLKK